jgi:hypothetical protein
MKITTMNKKTDEEFKRRLDKNIREIEEEQALYLLFDEMVKPDFHPDKKAESLYEEMKKRLNMDQEELEQ